MDISLNDQIKQLESDLIEGNAKLKELENERLTRMTTLQHSFNFIANCVNPKSVIDSPTPTFQWFQEGGSRGLIKHGKDCSFSLTMGDDPNESGFINNGDVKRFTGMEWGKNADIQWTTSVLDTCDIIFIVKNIMRDPTHPKDEKLFYMKWMGYKGEFWELDTKRSKNVGHCVQRWMKKVGN